MRRSIPATAGLLLLFAGCGGGSQVAHEAAPIFHEAFPSAAAVASHDIDAWIFQTEHEAAAVDRGAVDPYQFHLGAPPRAAELKLASDRGWVLGFDTYLSSIDMQRFTDLRATEEASFTCYVFDWYREHPYVIPDPEEFAEYMFENLVHYSLPPPGAVKLAGAVENFRKGIVEADNVPEAVANAALTAFCSLPKS